MEDRDSAKRRLAKVGATASKSIKIKTDFVEQIIVEQGRLQVEAVVIVLFSKAG